MLYPTGVKICTWEMICSLPIGYRLTYRLSQYSRDSVKMRAQSIEWFFEKSEPNCSLRECKDSILAHRKTQVNQGGMIYWST